MIAIIASLNSFSVISGLSGGGHVATAIGAAAATAIGAAAAAAAATAIGAAAPDTDSSSVSSETVDDNLGLFLISSISSFSSISPIFSYK